MRSSRIALLTLILALGGLLSPLLGQEARKPRIGISFDSLAVERWQKDRDIFIARAEEQGAECIFLSAEGDAKTQNEQCSALINQDVDVLVIVPKSATAAARAVAEAKKEDIPVLSYDRLILNADVDVYISFDNVRVGRMQAEYLVNQKKGRYYLLGGDPGDNNAKLFRQGQVEVLRPFVESGEITVIGQNWAKDWSPKSAREIMENVLVNVGSDIDVVVASNDGTAGGVIQALKAQGLDGKVLVSGQDADLQAIKRILDGTQSMTVYKPVQDLATRAADVALKLAKGEEIDDDQKIDNGYKEVPSILLDPITLDKENAVDVLTKDGFYTRQQLLD